MKNEIRLSLLCVAAVSVPAVAQETLPQCGSSNYDQPRKIFTILKPVEDIVNQQCLLTVYPKGTVPDQARQYPGSYIVEGNYVIELSGGGGGGGGGGSKGQGGGGGGAGAVPSKTVQYLSPGVYKLTIGTGGIGGRGEGGRTQTGNPTNLIDAKNGKLIAGFPNADIWTQGSRISGGGGGGAAAPGGSSGGGGGEAAQPGGQTSGYLGAPGQAGSGRQTDAGGGGGAGVGSGGEGGSADSNAPAGMGELGGGGGGGRGGKQTSRSGGSGGHGFIRLTMAQPAPQAAPPGQVIYAPGQVIYKYSQSTDTLFGFGKSTLKPSGEAKLGALVNKLKEYSGNSITLTGHADRIGSEEANQALSLRRAEAVKDYLVSNGLESDRISAVGRGESEPVTSEDACTGPATPEVISCLAPDRRVDIEVMGTQK